MSHAGAAPAASYKAESESKVKAEARLSVSQVDSEWAASSPHSCYRRGLVLSGDPILYSSEYIPHRLMTRKPMSMTSRSSIG